MASNLSDLTNLLNLITTVQGQTQQGRRTGGRTTQTQQTNVSDQGVNQLISQILSGQGGVRTIGNSARSAGVYDSTTEDLLYGDLYSRAANQAELARSPTVTVTDTPDIEEEIITPGVGMGSLGTTLAGSSVLSSILRNEVPLSGIGGRTPTAIIGGGENSIASAVSNITGLGSGSSAGAGAAPAGGFMGETVTGGVAGASGAAGSAGAAGGLYGNVATGGVQGAASGAGGLYANAATGGVQAGGSTAGSSLGGVGFGGAAAGAGGLLSGLTQEEEALGSVGNVAATIGGGFAAGGPVGAALAAAGAVLGSALKGGSIQGTIGNIPVIGSPISDVIGGVRSVGRSIGKAAGTVICTALVRTGHINAEEYREALAHMHASDPATVKGYHYWARPIARKIRRGHKGWTYFWKPFVRSRIALLVSDQSLSAHLRYPLGTVTKYGIEPACYALGKWLEYRESREARSSEVTSYGN